MNTVKATITGTSPLIMHNGRMANPLDKHAIRLREFTSIRKKTDQDYMNLLEVEFMGSLYYDKSVGVYIPGDNIEAMVRDGAKLKKRGASVQRGVSCVEDRIAFTYSGPRDPQTLWDTEDFRDIRNVKNGSTGGKTLRCRPIFREWSLTFTLAYESEQINERDLLQCLADAGQYIGLGDYRPGSPKGGRYGRFEVSKWES